MCVGIRALKICGAFVSRHTDNHKCNPSEDCGYSFRSLLLHRKMHVCIPRFYQNATSFKPSATICLNILSLHILLVNFFFYYIVEMTRFLRYLSVFLYSYVFCAAHFCKPPNPFLQNHLFLSENIHFLLNIHLFDIVLQMHAMRVLTAAACTAPHAHRGHSGDASKVFE